MLIATVFFSGMNLLVKLVPHIPAYEVVFFRCIVTLVMSFIYLKRRGIRIWGNNKKWLILRGIFGVTALTMYFTTLQKLPLASAVVIMYLSPIFTALFAIWLLGEKVKPLQWLFFAISFGGVFIIQFLGKVLINGEVQQLEPKYVLLGLGAAAISALAYNAVRKLKDTDHPVVVVFFFPLVGTPVISALAIPNWVMPQGWDWLLLIGVGVLTQFAQVFMTRALQSDRIAEVSSVRYIGIIYALALGFIFFGELYNWLSFIGIALVIAGVLLNLWYKKINSIKNTPQ